MRQQKRLAVACAAWIRIGGSAATRCVCLWQRVGQERLQRALIRSSVRQVGERDRMPYGVINAAASSAASALSMAAWVK